MEPCKMHERVVTTNDLTLVTNSYYKITENWILFSGRNVEDVMFEVAKNSYHVNKSHSFIMDPKDPIWKEYFSKDELREIQANDDRKYFDMDLPHELNSMLSRLNGLTTFKQMHDSISIVKADPVESPDAYWMKKSILNFLLLFIDGENLTLPSNGSDLSEMFRFVKTSSKLSGTTVQGLTDDSADMNFRYSSHGLLFTEIDLETENKLSLKTPTAMKNFFLNLLRQRRASINMGIKTVGINVNGLYISASIMSFDHGSISLLFKSEQLRLPKSVTEIPQLLPPILRLIYNLNQVVKGTINIIKDPNTITAELKAGESVYFPPCFVHNQNSWRNYYGEI